MSNTLELLAHRVTLITDRGIERRIWSSEKAVLLVLAATARGRNATSRLTTFEIASRTALSERSIRRAFATLGACRHITRDLSTPGAWIVPTLVHPKPTSDRQLPGPPPVRKKVLGPGLKRSVFERDAYRCLRCGTHIDLTVDHIVAESKGGTHTIDNLQTLCAPCNRAKGANGA